MKIELEGDGVPLKITLNVRSDYDTSHDIYAYLIAKTKSVCTYYVANV